MGKWLERQLLTLQGVQSIDAVSAQTRSAWKETLGWIYNAAYSGWLFIFPLIWLHGCWEWSLFLFFPLHVILGKTAKQLSWKPILFFYRDIILAVLILLNEFLWRHLISRLTNTQLHSHSIIFSKMISNLRNINGRGCENVLTRERPHFHS